MESTDHHVNAWYVLCGRTVLITISVISVSVFVFHSLILFGANIPEIITKASMIFGSLIWLVVSAVLWESYFTMPNKKRGVLVVAQIVSLIAVISVAGIFNADLDTTALWMNATIALLFSVSLIKEFPKAWRLVAKDQTTSE